jgi:hypothetical protein
MKKIFIAALCLGMLGMSGISYAKNEKDSYEQSQKQAREEVNRKVSKVAKQQAKDMKKQGWITSPGDMPLENQFDEEFVMRHEKDENHELKYVFGDGQSRGENYDAAKMQALTLASQNLAGNIQKEVTAIIDNNVANKQTNKEGVESVTKSIAAGKQFISNSLKRTIPVVECYRDLGGGNVEVRVVIAYSFAQAKEITKEAVREDLEKQGDDLQKQLEKILGW